jgi:hypothetical protein
MLADDPGSCTQRAKVFWFFFSKKNCLLGTSSRSVRVVGLCSRDRGSGRRCAVGRIGASEHTGEQCDREEKISQHEFDPFNRYVRGACRS